MTNFLKTKTQIKAWLDSHAIKNYVIVKGINYPYVVNVAGPVDFRNKGLTEIPVKFNKVKGDFVLSDNALTTLDFCPKVVGGSFLCASNKITSLAGFPLKIGGRINLVNNQIKSFKGLNIKRVTGTFNFSYNKLTSLKGCPEIIDLDFHVSSNQLTSLRGGPTFVGKTYKCSENLLTSLEGVPAKLSGGYFSCADNRLTSLEHCPQEIKGDFYFENNNVSNLAFFPKVCSRDIFSTGNPALKFLEGQHTYDLFEPVHLEHKKIVEENRAIFDSVALVSRNSINSPIKKSQKI